MAGQRLVAVYELLEQILWHLPPTELLRMLAVNSHFANTVRSSSILQFKFRMLLSSPLDSISFPLPIPKLFEYIGSRWSYPFGKQQNEPYVLAWIRKSQLACEQRGSWRGLLLSSDRMRAITVHVEGWGQLRWGMRKGELGQYNLKMRYEKSENGGITLGDLADVASELYGLDQSVDVKFSTYLNREGEAFVHDWEKARMLNYADVVEEQKANGGSIGRSSDGRVSLEEKEFLHFTPLSGGMQSCTTGSSILRGFCEHPGACVA